MYILTVWDCRLFISKCEKRWILSSSKCSSMTCSWFTPAGGVPRVGYKPKTKKYDERGTGVYHCRCRRALCYTLGSPLWWTSWYSCSQGTLQRHKFQRRSNTCPVQNEMSSWSPLCFYLTGCNLNSNQSPTLLLNLIQNCQQDPHWTIVSTNRQLTCLSIPQTASKPFTSPELVDSSRISLKGIFSIIWPHTSYSNWKLFIVSV